MVNTYKSVTINGKYLKTPINMDQGPMQCCRPTERSLPPKEMEMLPLAPPACQTRAGIPPKISLILSHMRNKYTWRKMGIDKTAIMIHQ